MVVHYKIASCMVTTVLEHVCRLYLECAADVLSDTFFLNPIIALRNNLA